MKIRQTGSFLHWYFKHTSSGHHGHIVYIIRQPSFLFKEGVNAIYTFRQNLI